MTSPARVLTKILAVIAGSALLGACSGSETPAGTAPAAPAGPAVEEVLSVPGPITVDGVEHKLAWSSVPTPGYYKQEYLPDGQDLERYRSMALVELLTEPPGDPGQAAAQQIRAMQQKTRIKPLKFEVGRNDATGEVLLDYIVFGTGPDQVDIAEWNVYRYARGAQGLVLSGYSRRAYGADQMPFLQSLKELRPRLAAEVRDRPLPAVAPRR